jgi:hypothetical protein
MRGVLQHNKNWLYKFPNFSLRTTKSSRVGSSVRRRSFIIYLFIPPRYQKAADTSASLRGFVDLVLAEDDLSRCVSDTTTKPTTVCQTQIKIGFI